MDNRNINWLIILFLITAGTAFGQKNVFVSKDVLKTAEWADFKYKDVMKKAVAGDKEAIKAFVDFTRYVEGVQGVEHAVTCLEIIPLTSDATFAFSIFSAPPKLKKVFWDRLLLAQGKTQNPELQKPLESWAPATWAVLNGKPLPRTALEEYAKSQDVPLGTAGATPAAGAPAAAGKSSNSSDVSPTVPKSKRSGQ